jgi:hypothetical protein
MHKQFHIILGAAVILLSGVLALIPTKNAAADGEVYYLQCYGKGNLGANQYRIYYQSGGSGSSSTLVWSADINGGFPDALLNNTPCEDATMRQIGNGSLAAALEFALWARQSGNVEKQTNTSGAIY